MLRTLLRSLFVFGPLLLAVTVANAHDNSRMLGGFRYLTKLVNEIEFSARVGARRRRRCLSVVLLHRGFVHL